MPSLIPPRGFLSSFIRTLLSRLIRAIPTGRKVSFPVLCPELAPAPFRHSSHAGA
jgi:hypothetical protein